MRIVVRFIPALVVVLLASAIRAELVPTPTAGGASAPAPADSPIAAPAVPPASAPRPNLDGDPPPEAVAAPPHRPLPGDPRTIHERMQRQKIERAAKLAAEDLAWVREQRAALARASDEATRDPRDRELEETEAMLLRRIAAYRARFGELTDDLRKSHDGKLPPDWNPQLDCPACP